MTQIRKKLHLLWIVLGLRIILFICELGVGLWSHSLSLLAGLSVLINGASIYLLGNDSHHDLNFRGVFLHGIADAASSLGVMLSAMVVYYWHWQWADAVASVFVASLISWSALSLFKEIAFI